MRPEFLTDKDCLRYMGRFEMAHCLHGLYREYEKENAAYPLRTRAKGTTRTTLFQCPSSRWSPVREFSRRMSPSKPQHVRVTTSRSLGHQSYCQFSWALVPDGMPPALISSRPADRRNQGLRSYISRVHRSFLLIRTFYISTFGFCARLSSKLAPPPHSCIYAF